jgi:hypothetical protein
MSDQDKKEDPNFYVREGQLRHRSYKDAWRFAWENADPTDRALISKLPNFDADVFYEITGIKVE